MDRLGVEQVVRSVLVDYGLPFSVAALSMSAGVWTVELVEPPSNRVNLTIHDGSGASVRRAVLRAFDIED